ncbi:hypothetical protein NP493_376g05011 [Ridgeia piscesae]|uniref:BHLH domain-containing protein n=1 Tax=Ridgeia piscesae TaxID=27915 RepID=A0AAD9L2N4_RIDPI|nr:hypothetical protein NP493_376g05011 [Ridgeia piscesae]
MMLKMKTTADDCCCGSMVVVSGLSVAKKYRRAYLRKIRRKEYRKLKAVVPSVAHKEKVSKVTVIEEAIKYIDELHDALADRLNIQQNSNESTKQLDLADLVKSFLASSLPDRRLPVVLQRRHTYEKPLQQPMASRGWTMDDKVPKARS